MLAEVNDDVRLLVLKSESGELLWSQPLASIEHTQFSDPMRRSAGVSPSYADGILICPTSAGAVVAVDLAGQRLRWGYRYGHGKSDGQSRQMQMQMMWNMRFGNYQGIPQSSCWHDAAAVIVDGRVLLTPVETDALCCLNLFSGVRSGRPCHGRTTCTWLACTAARSCWLAAASCGPSSCPTANRPGTGGPWPFPRRARPAAADSTTANSTMCRSPARK